MPALVVLLLLVAWLGTRDSVSALVGRLFPPGGIGLAPTLSIALGGPAVLFFLVLAHELGHVAGARLGGLGLVRMVVGPFEYRARVGVRIHSRFSEMTGLTVALPVGGAFPGGILPYIAGGPIASLVLGIIGAAVAILMPVAGDYAYAARALLGLLGGGSLVMGIVTLVPVSVAGLPSDGLRLLQLRPGAPSAHAHLSLLAVAAQDLAGVSPSRWDETALTAALELPAGSPAHLMARIFEYRYRRGKGLPQPAGRALGAALRSARGADHRVRAALAAETAAFCLEHPSLGPSEPWQAVANSYGV